MHLIESDYIELGKRRNVQLAVVHWQTVTQSSKREFQKNHKNYVIKIHLISYLLLVIVAVEWWFLTEIRAISWFVVNYNYIMLIIVFVHFVFLTLIQYILRREEPMSKGIEIPYLFLMIQLGSIPITRPALISDIDQFAYAYLFTTIMWCLSFFLSTRGYTESDYQPNYISLWSQKYFVTTSTSLLMVSQFKLFSIQLCISLFMVFFLSLFFVIWGRCLGSFKFYREEHKYNKYYTVLTYLNLISLLANSIILTKSFANI